MLTRSTVSKIVRAMSIQYPDAVALETDASVLTYRQLNDRADALARLLLETAKESQVRVAMQLRGTEAFLISSLAVVRSAMVAVPLDPTAPAAWRDRILRDCEAAILLTDSVPSAEDVAALPCPIIAPQLVSDEGAVPVEEVPGPVSSIIYTSGSTGVPKGVLMPTVDWDPTGGSEELVDSSDVEDFGTIETGMRSGFMGQGSVGWAHNLLLTGLTLRSTIVSCEVRGGSSETVGEWLARTGVESFVTVPTMLRHLMSTVPAGTTFPRLRFFVLYGETVTWEDLDKLFSFLSPESVVVVMFGSTESSFFATSMITAATPRGTGPIPIGNPLAGYEIQIEDELGEPVADGEDGELVVVGPIFAVGYWRRPELDEAVFEKRDDGRTHVRTGDLARRLPDGSIQHLGRKDHLVKVAGNRVELGEVEVALLKQPGVAEAVVATYRGRGESKRLTAAVVPAAGAQLSPRVLRGELARRLPAAMVPDEVLVLGELPRLANGKVDRLRLAEQREHRKAVQEAPQNVAPGGDADKDLERLRSIWCQVLERDDFGMHESFFDLGGDSLRAVELFVGIERELGVRCNPTVLFEASTVFDLAHALRIAAGGGTRITAVQVGDVAKPPLFVVNTGAGGFAAWHIAEQLGPEQPVYDIWADSHAPSFEEVANNCLSELLRVLPDGPFALYGFSLSGTLAFEIALQLQAAGRPASLVVLGDSPAPGGEPRLPVILSGIWLRTLDDPRPSVIARRVFGKLRPSQTRAEDSGDEPESDPFLDEWYRHLRLARRYQPSGRLRCPVVLQRSDDCLFGTRGWSRHVLPRISVRGVTGGHQNQIKESVPEVAKLLAAELSGIAPAESVPSPALTSS